MKERIIYISIIFALLVATGISINQCSSKSRQVSESQQNIDALMDVTRETRDRANRLQSERTIFMGDIETLKKLNADLVKEVEYQKGRVRVVTQIETRFIFDTIYLPNDVSKLNDSSFVINFEYAKEHNASNSIGFKGSVPAQVQKKDEGYILKSSNTTITDLNMKMKITTGIKEIDGKYTIFARTDFPGVKFDLDGAVVDPDESFSRKKKPLFSLMAGGGIGYGMTSTGAGIIPNVGLYVGINLLNF